MIVEGNDIYLFREELALYANTSLAYIDKKCSESRKLMRVTWRSKKVEGMTAVSYNSLPETTRQKMPSKADLKKTVAALRVERDAERESQTFEDLSFYIETEHYNSADLPYFQTKGITKAKAYDLSRAAAVLRFLDKYQTKTATRTIGYESKKELREAVLKYYLEKIHNPATHKYEFWYGFKVSNYKTLQGNELKWRNAFRTAFEQASNEPKIMKEDIAQRACLDELIPGTLGNQNRRVIGKTTGTDSDILLPGGRINVNEFHAARILNIAMNPGSGNKYDWEKVYLLYCVQLRKESKKPQAFSTVKDFLALPEVKEVITWERDGFEELDKILPNVRGKAPKAALCKGGLDGLQIDFYTTTTIVDKEGKEKTGDVMLTVVPVFDYYSTAITGFDVGIVESGELIRNAYRNHLNTVGRSYIEVETDRFSGAIMDDTKKVFEACCKKYRNTKPNDPKGKASNPKSRYVERLVQELNRLTPFVDGWKGTNITSQKDTNRKPNPDYKGETIESFEEAVAMIIDLFKVYNFEPLKKYNGACRWDRMIENIDDEARIIAPEVMTMLFNRWTKKQLNSELIQIKVNGRKHEYDFPGYEKYLPKIGKRRTVRVYYDETDMSTVDIFAMANPDRPEDMEGDKYLTTICSIERVYRDTASQTSADLNAIGEITRRRNDKTDALQRKELEVEASLYGIDIGGLDIATARRRVEGARQTEQEKFIPGFQEVFAEALGRPEAQSLGNYYEDRILTARGHKVPQTKEQKKKTGDLKRKLIDKKFAERRK